MKALTPEDMEDLFRQGMLAGDAEGLAGLYEADAVLYDVGPEFEFRGREAIRDHYRQVFTRMRPTAVELDTQVVEIADGLAYAHGTGAIHGAPGQPPVRVRVMDVRRRGADGLWRLVVDHISLDPANTPAS